MKKAFLATLTSLSTLLISASAAVASGGEGQVIHDHKWSFEGPFGSYDELQLQRGLQVYTEVCSSCHGLKFVSFYSLDDNGGPALPEDQVRAYTSRFQVWNESARADEEGEYSDHFPTSVDPKAPDLSLMAKARAGFSGPYGLGINQIVKGMGGPEYVYSILTGFTGEQIEEAGSVFYENLAFSGHKIAMPPPLSDGIVSYSDGSPETLEQYAEDVTAFLMWAAEPKLNERKSAGLVAVLMLFLSTVMLYLTNKAIWYPIKHRNKE